MAASTQDPTGCNLTTSTNCYVTSSTDYSGTLDNVTSSNTGTGTTIPTTYDYVLAKYDGTNAGYVLFYMPTYDGGSYTIPEYSYSIWNTTTGQGNPVQASYQLSGWVGFTVPDGGSTVTLLGSVLLGLSVLRRRLSKN
jgi:hypothetical protein